jgi:RNA polymerase sigma factor (sigma-70 family)
VAKPLAFLRHVSTHRAIDRFRADKARQQALDEWAAVAEANGSSAPDGADLLAFRQQVDRLERCIAALPPRCRDVFVLHRIHDLHQQEVADRLCISRGMVARHMARAMAALAPLFDEFTVKVESAGSQP